MIICCIFQWKINSHFTKVKIFILNRRKGKRESKKSPNLCKKSKWTTINRTIERIIAIHIMNWASWLILWYINAVSHRSYVQCVLNPCDQSEDLNNKWEELDGYWLNDQTERDNIHCSSHFEYGLTNCMKWKCNSFVGN